MSYSDINSGPGKLKAGYGQAGSPYGGISGQPGTPAGHDTRGLAEIIQAGLSYEEQLRAKMERGEPLSDDPAEAKRLAAWLRAPDYEPSGSNNIYDPINDQGTAVDFGAAQQQEFNDYLGSHRGVNTLYEGTPDAQKGDLESIIRGVLGGAPSSGIWDFADLLKQQRQAGREGNSFAAQPPEETTNTDPLDSVLDTTGDFLNDKLDGLGVDFGELQSLGNSILSGDIFSQVGDKIGDVVDTVGNAASTVGGVVDSVPGGQDQTQTDDGLSDLDIFNQDPIDDLFNTSLDDSINALLGGEVNPLDPNTWDTDGDGIPNVVYSNGELVEGEGQDSAGDTDVTSGGIDPAGNVSVGDNDNTTVYGSDGQVTGGGTIFTSTNNDSLDPNEPLGTTDPLVDPDLNTGTDDVLTTDTDLNTNNGPDAKTTIDDYLNEDGHLDINNPLDHTNPLEPADDILSDLGVDDGLDGVNTGGTHTDSTADPDDLGTVGDILSDLGVDDGLDTGGTTDGNFDMGMLDDFFTNLGSSLGELPGQIGTGIGDALGSLFTGEGLASAGAAIYNINNQKDAAKEMRAAMDRATASQQNMYDQSRADLAPYRVSPAGANAAAGFGGATGLPNVDPSSAGTAFDASQLTDPSQAIYGGSNGLPDPKLGGNLTEGLPDFANYDDPAYEWLRKENMRGIQDQAAARGKLGSGGTMTAMQDRSAGLAGNQMDKVAAMRNQMFNERLGEQHQKFGQASSLRDQLFGEGVTESDLQFGQLSARERAETGQQALSFEQENMKRQQNYANSLQLRNMLFGEQLSADETDFLQRYNMASMGANAAARQSSNAMQQGQNAANLGMMGGALNVGSAAGQSGIINDFVKSLYTA